MHSKLQAHEKKYPDELPLDETSRPGPRTWGKLHDMIRRVKFLRYQPLVSILTHVDEDKGAKTKVTRTDPETGVSRVFEEWVEVSKHLSSPHALTMA